ncbi:MAG: iron transporter [Nocardioidaceae bacterium]
MHRKALALAATPILALTACGGEGSAAEPDGSGVPSGVAEQYSTLKEEVAERGGETTSGDWTISYIVEAAEPWHESHGGHQQFREPAPGETHHIEIIPRESSTGRIVPDVPITVEVVDAEGTVVDEKELNFYYSTFFHYANNFTIPKDGKYTLRASLEAPTFLRHGEENEEPALDEGTKVTFENVDLTQG